MILKIILKKFLKKNNKKKKKKKKLTPSIDIIMGTKWKGKNHVFMIGMMAQIITSSLNGKGY